MKSIKVLVGLSIVFMTVVAYATVTTNNVLTGLGASSVSAVDGTVALPSMSFASDTDSGFYRIGANDIGLSLGGVLGMEAVNIGSSVINFGFGTTASASNLVPAIFDRNVNGVATWQYGNSSAGASSVTSFFIYNGAGANYLQIENWANQTTNTYLGGGSVIDSSTNQAQLIIASEGASSFIGFPVGGKTLADEKMRIAASGKISYPVTMTAGGVTGAQTINKITGSVNFAAGASTLVVTNSLVAATSIVFAVVRTADATCALKNVVPASGSFTITLTAVCTAETSVGFFVVN